MIRSFRPDAGAKLAGTAGFGYDLDRPGMRFGALVLAARAHGRLDSVDLAPARALPGVVAIAADDLSTLLDGAHGDPERPPFASREVMYDGQPIAAVAAPTLAGARAAAAAVVATLAPLPVVADLESVFPEWPEAPIASSAPIAAHVHARRGDVDRALREAATVVRGTYRTSGVHQVALEPHACLAEVRDGRWHVTTSTQSPFGVREDVAGILGIPERSIVVDGTWVGGGFGGKGASLVEPYALLLARAAGAPVRLALTYREAFRLGRTTLPSVVRMETGVTDGAIVARRVRLLLDVGTSLPGRDFATGYAIGFLLGPYRTPAFEVEGYAVRTHKPPFGPHRAPYAPQAAFVVESHLNEVARAIGEDPAAFRARHVLAEGDRTALGQEVSAFGLSEVLRRATAVRDAWRRDAGPGRGVGLGLGFWATNTGAGGEARVLLSPTGLEIVQGEREIGSGSVAVGLVAAAERSTGLPRDAIRVTYRDTSAAPFDAGVFGSRTVGALGQAVDAACRAALAALGDRLGGAGELRLELEGDEVVAVRGTARRPVRSLLTPEERRDGGLAADGRHTGAPRTIDESLVVEGGFYPYQDFTGAAHVAEVDVDRETGAVRVVRYAAFHDVGVVVDRPTATAQIEGGIVMGLGAALTEESIWSDDGRLLNPGLLDYRIPTLGEVPPIDVTFVEGFAGAGPFGAKGLGEPPIIPVPATIAAAIRDATGVSLTELPFTPERVARALKRA